MYFARNERRTRPIPLTPLIDVVFLLIVFFMLSTTFIRIQAMELGLPGNAEGKGVAGASPLLIDVAGNGGVYWQRELVLPTTLRMRLETELKRDPNRKVLVRSGKGITVQKLVSVLDIVYLAGVKDVAVDKWDEGDLPVPVTPEAMEKEDKALGKAIEQEEENTPVLKQEEIDALPKGRFTPQEQFEDMIEGLE